MSHAQQVRQAYIDWSAHHTGWMIDTLIRNFYTPKDAPPEDVIVVVGIDSALYVEHELRELRERGGGCAGRGYRPGIDSGAHIGFEDRDHFLGLRSERMLRARGPEGQRAGTPFC